VSVLTVVVTHDRLPYTRRTIASLTGTTGYLVAVDNNSTDGTQEWLASHDCKADHVIYSDRNLFPGAATNIGWHEGLKRFPEATLLHRSDNDIEYADGWTDVVEEAFAAHTELGLFGVLNLREDFPQGQPLNPYTVNGVTVNRFWPRLGGNVVMRRSLWDDGLRWEPGEWKPGGQDEDAQMSGLVENAGYYHANAVEPIAGNLAFHGYDVFPDYYDETARIRGLVPETSV
jgi:glycosyltransferase involved in cell wall biosynthesis